MSDNLMKQMARQKADDLLAEKKRRLNYMRDELKAQISTLQLQLEAYDCLHTDLEYLQEG